MSEFGLSHEYKRLRDRTLVVFAIALLGTAALCNTWVVSAPDDGIYITKSESGGLHYRVEPADESEEPEFPVGAVVNLHYEHDLIEAEAIAGCAHVMMDNFDKGWMRGEMEGECAPIAEAEDLEQTRLFVGEEQGADVQRSAHERKGWLVGISGIVTGLLGGCAYLYNLQRNSERFNNGRSSSTVYAPPTPRSSNYSDGAWLRFEQSAYGESGTEYGGAAMPEPQLLLTSAEKGMNDGDSGHLLRIKGAVGDGIEVLDSDGTVITRLE